MESQIPRIWIIGVAVVIIAILFYIQFKRKPKNLFRIGAAVPLNETITIVSPISQKQYTSAAISPGLKRLGKINLGVGILFVVCILVLLITNQAHAEALLHFLPWTLPFLVLAFWIRAVTRRMYKNSPMLQETITYTLGPERYEIRTPTTQASGEWTHIHGYRETNDMLLIYTSSVNALFLRKDACTPADLQSVRAFVQTNFQKIG